MACAKNPEALIWRPFPPLRYSSALMRALALLGPNAETSDVAAFESAAQTAIPSANRIDPAAPPDVALIFGGDGTVHRNLGDLLQTQVPALVVPTGSGNDFARALGLRNRARALAAWRRFCATRSHTRRIDVGEISGTHEASSAASQLFCCVAGAGIDSDVNRRANRMPRWLRAHGGYALSVLPAAARYKPGQITVEYEDHAGSAGKLSGPALMCAFANTDSYGHGMRIAPGAKLDDGLLELIFVRQASAVRLLKLFPTVYFGAHLHLPEVEHRRVMRLEISADPPLEIYADGEYICQTPAKVRVRPKALHVIV